MRYESIGNISLPKIGFGTWKIGGVLNANHSIDLQSLAALHSALELGYTHIDSAEAYAAGHTEELLGQAIRESGIKRETRPRLSLNISSMMPS
jgi:diketogulonate reductase-like aldo/keto reductase